MRSRFLLPLLALAAGSCSTPPEETPATAPDTPPSSGVFIEDDTVGIQDASTTTTEPITTSQGDELSEQSDRVARRQEQRAYLAAEYIKRGDALIDSADFEGALASFASALEVDPGNTEARERMARVEALLGDRYAVAADAIQDATDREVVRRAQALLEAERAATLGDVALGEGDYDEAIEQYRNAEVILRYHPLIATDSLDERIVAGKLQTAIQLQEEARIADRREREEAARREREARERQQREYRENLLRTLYDQANTAFLNERFKRAEQLCDQILLHDRDNEAAKSLKAIAREARHASSDQRNRRDYREQWLRTFDDLSTMNVIQVEPLVFDDLKRWKEVLNRRPKEFGDLDASEIADKAAVLAILESTRFAPNFGDEVEGAPLSEVASYLQTLTGVNFIVSPRVAEDLDEEETAISLDLPERDVLTVLELIAETKESLRWKVEDGVVKFVTVEEMVGGQVLSMYEVRDLIQPIRDFPGREINVSPSGGIFLPEDDIEEREANVVTADALETLIRNTIAIESWDTDPANTIAITELGTLVINQTPEVHEQIVTLLEDLREATGIMVNIQSRFLKVEDNFLEDIGVDFRGLGEPGPGTNAFFNDFGDPSTQSDLGQEIGQSTDLGAFLDEGGDGDLRGRVEQLYDSAIGDEDVLEASGGLSFQWTYLNDLELQLILRAVSKSERVELVTAPNVLVYNTARANLTVMNQVAYVKDFDVEIAQAASIADPIVDVVQDGVILDVRPVVSADRRFITLELRPTIAELQRPIMEVATTLGSQNSVTIQLPELEIQRVRTSIPMPDGGTVLLGGMKVSENQDQASGVPILNKIPVISFFFERQGHYVSNRKLLILLKANIVIPQEHEPTPAQLGVIGKKPASGM